VNNVAQSLVITVDFEDESDVDWIRIRAVAAVEDVVGEAEEENRLDGKVEVGWELED
jgi:hypothetical protein